MLSKSALGPLYNNSFVHICEVCAFRATEAGCTANVLLRDEPSIKKVIENYAALGRDLNNKMRNLSNTYNAEFEVNKREKSVLNMEIRKLQKERKEKFDQLANVFSAVQINRLKETYDQGCSNSVGRNR